MSEPFITIPGPGCRPGDAPDFSDFKTPVAGAVSRPAIDVSADDMQDMAYNIIRVTDDDGVAQGSWADSLTNEEKLAGLRDMMTLRAFDQRLVLAQRQGKTSFYMQALGEEAIACAFQRALEKGDMNFPTYRQQGLLVAGGYPLELMMNQVYSNEKDPLLGRQMPVFYASKEYGYFSISGNLGTQYIQAVGWAMAAAIDGKKKVASAWIGDGATAESDFHAALVFASTYKPPVILNIVNNQWAISTFQAVAKGQAATFAARGLGFGIPALQVDGNDFLAVHAVAKWATERARAGLGPTMIEHVTYRVGPHSTSDDPSAYRPREEAKNWPLGDPIERLKQHLITTGAWSEERHEQALHEIETEVIEIQKRAEKTGTLQDGRRPSPKEIFNDVYEDLPPHLIRQRQQAGV